MTADKGVSHCKKKKTKTIKNNNLASRADTSINCQLRVFSHGGFLCVHKAGGKKGKKWEKLHTHFIESCCRARKNN